MVDDATGSSWTDYHCSLYLGETMKFHKCSNCNTIKLFTPDSWSSLYCDIVEQCKNEYGELSAMVRCGGTYREVELSNGITLDMKD